MKAQKYRQLFLALHGKNERLLARQVQKALRSDIKDLWIGNITDLNYMDVLKGVKLTKTTEVIIDAYINNGIKIGEIAKKNIESQIKRGSPFFSEVWTSFVLRFIAPDLANRIVSIQATLVDDLIKLISNEISNNRGIFDIADAITDFVDSPKFYKWQSLRIARTETSIAMNSATYQAGKEAGVLLNNEWISAEDNKVRPSHAEMNGLRVELGQKFPNGLLYPADPTGSAAEIINCRCTFLQVPVRDKNGDIIYTT
jgi:SPP1 gp7 family putative phage head morphogenesis protein